MDRWWQSVADFLEAHGLGGEGVVAPSELSALFPVDRAYANVSLSESDETVVLVLHKGRYEELDRGFTRRVLNRLHPVFANEVFIVLAESGEELADDDPHIDKLQAIRAWANSRGETTERLKQRMPAAYMGNGAILVETIHGHLIALPAGDRAITPHIIRDGYFDLGVTRFLERFLRPGMTFVDVGANIGVYALLAARSVGATGRVIAIEALPRLQTILIDNFGMNGFWERVRVLPFAAADKPGELEFFDFARYDGASTAVAWVAELQQQRFLDTPRRVAVRSKTLSALLGETDVNRADLIKIDVEGFEWEVLQGARDFLAAQERIALVLEWHSEFMPPARQEQVHTMLVDELRCRIERIETDGSTAPIGFDALRGVAHADLFAYRR